MATYRDMGIENCKRKRLCENPLLLYRELSFLKWLHRINLTLAIWIFYLLAPLPRIFRKGSLPSKYTHFRTIPLVKKKMSTELVMQFVWGTGEVLVIFIRVTSAFPSWRNSFQNSVTGFRYLSDKTLQRHAWYWNTPSCGANNWQPLVKRASVHRKKSRASDSLGRVLDPHTRDNDLIDGFFLFDRWHRHFMEAS